MAKKSLSDLGGLVYSTEVGRTCPVCRQAIAECVCHVPKRPAGDGIVRVSRETKGRAGKGVTLVKGVPLDDDALIALGKKLKAACGVNLDRAKATSAGSVSPQSEPQTVSGRTASVALCAASFS